MADFSKAAGHNGTFNNYLGVKIGELANAVTAGDITLDSNEETGLYNFDRNLETLLSFATLDGMMNARSALSYRTPAYRAKMDMERAEHTASLAFGEPKLWETIKTGLKGGTLLRDLQAFGNNVDILAKQVENGEIDPTSPERWQKIQDVYKNATRGTEGEEAWNTLLDGIKQAQRRR